MKHSLKDRPRDFFSLMQNVKAKIRSCIEHPTKISIGNSGKMWIAWMHAWMYDRERERTKTVVAGDAVVPTDALTTRTALVYRRGSHANGTCRVYEAEVQ